MKSTNIFFSALLCCFFLASNLSAADIKEKIAVLPFELQGEHFETRDLGNIVSEWLITAFVQNGRFEVVERKLLEKVMEEQNMVEAGFATQETAMEVGRILGVKVIVSGTVTKYRRMLDVNARVIDVGSASIVTAENVRSKNKDKLKEHLYIMAEKIASNFPLEGAIIKRKDKNAILNLGQLDGVKSEMIFVSYKNGDEIKDPKTQEVLFVEEIKTGVLKVKEVRDKVSVASIIEEDFLHSIGTENLVKSQEEFSEKDILSMSQKNAASKKLSDLADMSNEADDSLVKISTSKGSGAPVYRQGEKIIFYMQVNKPLYVYIYDIDLKDNVSLLYPYTPDAFQKKLLPRVLYTIPQKTDDFEMIVEPPFGTDAVKIFASTEKLPISDLNSNIATRSYRGGARAIKSARKEAQKELSSQQSINPNDLVDYYRGLADKFNVELYEDSLILETIP